MSKKLSLLAILFFVIGAVMCLLNFNPITSIQTFIQNPSTILPLLNTATEYIKQNIVGFIAGIGMMVGLVAKAVSSLKQTQQTNQENLNQIRSESTTAINKLTMDKEQAETQLKETTQTYSQNFADMSENYVKLQDQLQDVTAENKQLVKQLADERTYYQKQIENFEAEKRKAKLVA